jgi:hypothetical protein
MRTAHNYCLKFEAALAKIENQGGGKGNSKLGAFLVSRLRPRQVRYQAALRPDFVLI